MHFMAVNWGVNLIRLSLFSSEAVAFSDKDWRVITNQDESELRQNVIGGKRLAGKFLNGNFTAVAAANRIDFLLTAEEPVSDPNSAEDAPPPFTIPVIAEWDKTCAAFVAATSNWLKDSELKFVRIAFGGVLLSQTPGRLQAYEQMSKLLVSVKIDPAKMRDFLYRINWPVQSRVVNGLTINRLTTWDALRFVRKHIAIIGTQLGPDAATEELEAVRLELDHNTEESRSEPFDPARLLPVYNELVELALENAAAGERP
jgi:hypothetical protein